MLLSLPVTDPTLIFFVVLAIILLAPLVMGKLRIPHIIGMVLAGVVIGEHGLGVLGRDESFEMFGRVGLLYIMFLAGLEMNLSDIKKQGRRMLLFGLLTFLVPFALGYGAGVWLMGYSRGASLLLACILSSNTLIAYPIVSRYGLQKHRSVVLGVGGSMVALTLALLTLAAFAASWKGETSATFWALFALKVAAFCVGVAWVLPRVTRWFFNRYDDAVMLFAYVLAMLFLSAAVSDACGLEGIFGAFLAGLMFNRFIPAVSPLMNRLEFIGNALFIPYFLIGVGMLINVRVMFSSVATAWIVVAMVVAGTLGKAVAAYFTAPLLGMGRRSGHMMFGLTTAHAAGSIAMVMVGMGLLTREGAPLVDTSMLNGVVMMILFTCIISTITVDRASQGILLQERLHAFEPSTQGDDEKILLPLQHSANAEQLVRLALLTRNAKLGRGIIGINVVHDDQYGEREKAEGERVLAQAVAVAASADVRMQTQSRLATNIANGIKHAFKENYASEIIMGMHRQRTAGDSFWGAYTQTMIAEINRQIMICRLSRPLNVMRMIHVAVPSRVEFEAGFYRWVERLARMAGGLGCRIVFHGRQSSLSLIEEYVKALHPDVRAEYADMEHWIGLTQLESEVHDDHLFIVITARIGTVSYKSSFEKLPRELSEHFSHCSLIVVYPDQNGQPQGTMTFTAPQLQSDESAYAQIIGWMMRKFGKLKIRK